MLIVTGARFAEAAEYALIAVDNHHRHAGGAAAVINMFGEAVDHIRSKYRINARLNRLG